MKMKTEKVITANLKASRIKMEEHKANFRQFNWRGEELRRAEQTLRYNQGWINALDFVLG